MLRKLLMIAFLFASLSNLSAQTDTEKKEQVIEGYGTVYPVEKPFFNLEKNKKYKVVFDVGSSPKDTSKLNSLLNAVARLYNMHVQAGVPKENIEVALVLHGSATKNVLKNEVFQKRYKIDNPNLDILEKLDKAGVHVYVCGQSASYHKIAQADMSKSVRMSLSALTVLISYQSNGYQLISF